MKKYTVCVSACGGDIATNVIEILRNLDSVGEVHGIDCSFFGWAGERCDSVAIVPKASDPGYRNMVKTHLAKVGADLFIPVSEPEVLFWGQQDGSELSAMLVPNQLSCEIGGDKLATARFLVEHGFPAPWTLASTEGTWNSLPFIAKPRFSSGSRGIHLITSGDSPMIEAIRGGSFVFQEYLAGDDNEYTCGLYRSACGVVHSMVLRRRLTGGLTGYAEVVDEPVITELLGELANALELRGSINVQLRLVGGVPYVFEINPRFSSTVYVRHQLGFCDLQWCLDEHFGQPPPYELTTLPPGTKLYRDPSVFHILPPQGRK